MNIAAYIDHTILKAETAPAAIEQLCREAVSAAFKAVCVPPYYVGTAKKILTGSEVAIATVIGFPFGYSAIGAKVAEIRDAISQGADELDMVINLAALKSGNWSYLQEEIDACIQPVKEAGKILKVIVESGILTDDELAQCCALYGATAIDFMKTSTGYAAAGASVEAVATMRRLLPAPIAIKASGGVKSFAFAQALIEAGATRIGCSASLQILAESRKEN